MNNRNSFSAFATVFAIFFVICMVLSMLAYGAGFYVILHFLEKHW